MADETILGEGKVLTYNERCLKRPASGGSPTIHVRQQVQVKAFYSSIIEVAYL
ncbi:MAG TPA: hypothetical protein VKV18_00215 [Chthonomonas sp.]|uniref:hypothetical protein n=1 Tax=Chthonomonas sp. TaxID=2282153 RepID=UPI002B4AD5CB|nr:hypothetical protein [Chthonomonas sp.]HLI47105.1 hypothetical protein [Chthonomonas sp.]